VARTIRMAIPMKAITDSDLIPITCSEPIPLTRSGPMPIAIGAKRRWRMDVD
jgi:hypothetical protein